MIKARADNLIVFGLSAKNIEKLMEEKPIFFDADVLGLPGIRVTIIYGKTEQTLLAHLRKLGFELPPK
jgi:hypothetical protein